MGIEKTNVSDYYEFEKVRIGHKIKWKVNYLHILQFFELNSVFFKKNYPKFGLLIKKKNYAVIFLISCLILKIFFFFWLKPKFCYRQVFE